MSITAVQVRAKAKAFVDALGRMPRSQYAAVPRGHFARDFNTLRKLAREACPGLDERLLGKYVPVRQLTSGGEVSEASFVEIETYARQIFEQLTLVLPPAEAGTPASTPAPTGGRTPLAQAGKPWDPTEM